MDNAIVNVALPFIGTSPSTSVEALQNVFTDPIGGYIVFAFCFGRGERADHEHRRLRIRARRQG
jgi:hypothetical protein